MPKTKHIKFLKAVPEKKLWKDIQTDGVYFIEPSGWSIIKTIHTSQNRHICFFFNLHRLNPTLAESRAILNIKAEALFRKELIFVMIDSSRI